MMLKNLLLVGLLVVAGAANAYDSSISKSSAYQELTQAQKETYVYDHYFIFAAPSADEINLLNLRRIGTAFPQPAKDYDRDNQFGEWINPDKNTCLSTRGIVLKRDSTVDISVNDKCTVESGRWYDPYTDKYYTDADDIQIDHVVALKNAYMTGGYAWNAKKKCLYANYLGNNFHLLAVSGPENMKKSDKSPLEYVPPNRAFVCEYLRAWLEIKYIWQLRMTPREVVAIKSEIKSNNCTDKDMTISMVDVQTQRQFIETNKNLCQ